MLFCMPQNKPSKVTADRRGFWGGVVSAMEIQPNTPSFKRSYVVRRRTAELNTAQVKRDWECVGEFLRVAIEQSQFSR